MAEKGKEGFRESGQRRKGVAGSPSGCKTGRAQGRVDDSESAPRLAPTLEMRKGVVGRMLKTVHSDVPGTALFVRRHQLVELAFNRHGAASVVYEEIPEGEAVAEKDGGDLEPGTDKHSAKPVLTGGGPQAKSEPRPSGSSGTQDLGNPAIAPASSRITDSDTGSQDAGPPLKRIHRRFTVDEMRKISHEKGFWRS